MSSELLKSAASKYVLGLLCEDDLPTLATRALEGGQDSPSMRELAGLTHSEIDEAVETFRRALEEQKNDLPSKREAVIWLAKRLSAQIINATISPYDGAKRIWRLSLRAPNEHFPELDSFIYAASEWEDRVEDRSAFDAGILTAARDFMTDC
ncbi:MAG: hypothetical protein R3A47_06405 [Polyangiales bacterium]